MKAVEKVSPAVQEAVRVSEDVEEWAADLARRRSRSKTREKFLEDVRAGKRSLDVLKVKLYPHQEEGMLHLAFGERALLADESGERSFCNVSTRCVCSAIYPAAAP